MKARLLLQRFARIEAAPEVKIARAIRRGRFEDLNDDELDDAIKILDQQILAEGATPEQVELLRTCSDDDLDAWAEGHYAKIKDKALREFIESVHSKDRRRAPATRSRRQNQKIPRTHAIG